MSRVFIRTLVLIALLVGVLPGTPAWAQVADSFEIAYGDTVSDGVPGPGAGNIEVAGGTDAYSFEGVAGDVAIFDVLAGSNTTFLWRLEGPGGGALFDGLYVDREVELPATGTYVLTVRGFSAASTGTYSFRLLLTPPPQEFSIAFGDTVSQDVPAPGAGNLEVPGAIDRYLFDVTAGQVAIFDALTGNNTQVRWALHAPDGTQVFDRLYIDHQETLAQTGAYVLTMSGVNIASTGTYSFQLLQGAGTQEFTIAFGDTVSDGVPGPGAGNLEGPGAIDRYLFEGMTGQVAILDALSGDNTQIAWSLHAPGGAALFDSIYVDQEVVLPQDGTYTITLKGLTATGFGVYSFQLLGVPPQVDEFTIAFGDTVSDGVPGPGAGNLEGPGAIDRYLFEGTTGQAAILDALTGDNTQIAWSLHAPGGAELFDSIYVDREVVLPQDGTYTISVKGLTITGFGVYSFQLREPPPNTPPVATDDEAETDFETPVTIDVLANDTDADGDALTIDAVTQPANGIAVIDGNQVTYTPGAGFSGDDSFTYTVSDGRGGTDDATVSVTVHERPNRPPTIEEIPDQESTVGDAVSLPVQAGDPDGDALAFSTTGLPPGLSIDPVTGEISGTIEAGAEVESPYPVEVTAADPDGASASTGFQWVVHPVAGDVVEIRIDILAPCIFNNGYGFIPVLIYGSEQVDGNDIDLSTVELEGMPVKQLFGWYMGFVHDYDNDGYDDVLVLIEERAGAIPQGATSATLTGQLEDGTGIEGSDRICILPQ